MRKAVDYVPRQAEGLVVEALADTRVVVVNGARQVGKSTLAEVALRRVPGGVARFLDDPVTRTAAAEDPVRFVRHDGLMLIDEIQRVPQLWLTIKNVVDRNPRPGSFLLTGSARSGRLRSPSSPSTATWRTSSRGTSSRWPTSNERATYGACCRCSPPRRAVCSTSAASPAVW